MPVFILLPAVAAALIAIACAALANGRKARFLVPVSGALLAAVALFGLLPEIAASTGWPLTLATAAAGYLTLHLLEHFGYPVCPSCSHDAEFAGFLIVAVAIHAFIDGWGMVAVANRGVVSTAIIAAMMLHKIPEGLALGAMLPRRNAFALAVVAESPTVLGGATGLWATPVNWVNFPLAVAAGMFLFLGIHAIIPKR